MDGGTVLVLGAGATLGGGFRIQRDNGNFQPPLDRDFFETPAVQVIFNRDGFPTLAHYQRVSSLETTWAAVDLYHKLCRTGIISEEVTDQTLAVALEQRANGDQAYRMKMEREARRWRVPSMAGWEVLNVISRVFQALIHPNPQQSALHVLVERLLQQLLLGVITFNYDTSLERLQEQLHQNQFYYPLLEGQNSERRFPLFKLHGSLNWQTDSLNRRITVLGPDQIAEMNHGDGWYRQPEVVGPTFFKQEITFDVQQDFRAIYYRQLWGNAWDLLRSARYLIFVGFSFPQTDFHAQALFRTAHLSGNGFRRVVLCHHHDANLRGIASQVFADRPVLFTEFKDGLESMAGRLDEVVHLLQS